MKQCHRNLLLLLHFCVAFGQSGTGVRIDGFNSMMWSDSLWYGNDNFSITQGNPADSFYAIPQFNASDSISPIIYGRMLIGAETGDPLLNRFTPGPFYANRDHRTLGEMSLRHPEKSLGIITRYRYVDTYSDRFDYLWKEFSHLNGRQMEFSMGGLTSELFTGARFSTGHFQSDLSYTWFARWHASPVFFYPIYRRGYSLISNSRWEKEGFCFASHLDYTPSSWYYDHSTPVMYHDLSGSLTSRFNAKSHPFSGQCTIDFNSALTPATKVDMRAGVGDSSKHCGADVAVYEDSRKSGSIFGKIRFAKALNCSLLVGRIVRPRERSFRFWVKNTPIRYKPTISTSNIIASEVRWDKKGIVDVTAAGWLHYCSDPLWEVGPDFNDTDNAPEIRQAVQPDGTTLFSGVRAQCKRVRKWYAVELHAGMVMPVDKDPLVRYHIGKTGTLRFTASTRGVHPATASITLSARDKLVVRYLDATTLNGERLDELTSPALYSLDASLRIPVILPWASDLLDETAFRVNVNSLRLMKELRVREHPTGNEIGPEVIAGFDAQIR